MAKDEGWYARNPKWRNIPELMLRYRSASWFIRTTEPGIMMGFQTKDEAEDADYEEIPVVNTAVDQLSAEEKLAQAQEKEQKEANTQSMDMNTSGNATEEEPSKDTIKPENKKTQTAASKPQPIGKQELPNMFQQP